MNAKNRLIVALDFHTLADVKKLVTALEEHVRYYKVGMELFYATGGEVVTWLKSEGKQVFVDLKLHDIPNTVASGLCSLMALDADMVNVHAGGGFSMMETAVKCLREAAENQGKKTPKIIAVTVLTSIGSDEWKELGHTLSIEETVLCYAKLAKKAGLDGVVSSPQEAKRIREACGDDFLIVTPGIRPIGADINDQNRIATPSAALKNGATHLVIGRPIRAAEDPKLAAIHILNEMEDVL